jgi:hypothetical protein
MNKKPLYVGLIVLLSIGLALLGGCRADTAGSDAEATIQAAMEATLLARAPQPTQLPGAEIGPPAPVRSPQPTLETPDDGIRRVSAAELKAMVDAGEAIIVDSRPVKSYNEKHIAGAISIPYDQVTQRYTELPTDKHISFY